MFAEHGPVLRALADAAADDPDVDEVYGQLVKSFVDVTAEHIEHEIAAGRILPLDARETAKALVWMNERYLTLSLGREPTSDRAVVARTLAHDLVARPLRRRLVHAYCSQAPAAPSRRRSPRPPAPRAAAGVARASVATRSPASASIPARTHAPAPRPEPSARIAPSASATSRAPRPIASAWPSRLSAMPPTQPPPSSRGMTIRPAPKPSRPSDWRPAIDDVHPARLSARGVVGHSRSRRRERYWRGVAGRLTVAGVLHREARRLRRRDAVPDRFLRAMSLDTARCAGTASSRLLYIGQAVSFAGSMITFVAIPFQVYELTRSTFVVGLLGLAQLAPLLLTALVGGAMADAHDRRRLVLIADAALFVLSLMLVANALLADPQVWLLFVVAAGMSAAGGVQRPRSTRWSRASCRAPSCRQPRRSRDCAATAGRSPAQHSAAF